MDGFRSRGICFCGNNAERSNVYNIITLPAEQNSYGLYGQDELTQKEVADLLNISQSYISRLEKKILKKL